MYRTVPTVSGAHNALKTNPYHPDTLSTYLANLILPNIHNMADLLCCMAHIHHDHACWCMLFETSATRYHMQWPQQRTPH